MLFNSLDYLVFLPIVFILYYYLPHRFRWILLLLSSYYFYMCWRWDYLILIIISTLVDFKVGHLLFKSEDSLKRKVYLFFSLLVNLGLLAYFKYADFIIGNINSLSKELNLTLEVDYLNILLPVGISFYTFQTLSYTIDIYNRKIEPETHLGRFAVFVSFFPQLVAGPIERASHLIPQFRVKKGFNYPVAVSGLRRILWGLFKKIVVADRLSIIVDQIYATSGDQNGFALLLATYFFAFQIYCDFSGYSDIAIGSARLLNISLMENFRTPYFSRSISEFWSRWHISLSTWFRDYLYIPLGGNRSNRWRVFFNIYIVFLVSGLWHGANWTFIIWGGIHGIYLIIEKVLKLGVEQKVSQGGDIFRILISFHLVLLGWVFFRAENLHHAFLVLEKICRISEWNVGLHQLYIGDNAKVISIADTYLGIMAICILLVVDVVLHKKKFKNWFLSRNRFIRWTTYLVFALAIVIFGYHGETEFIYFQF